MRQRARTPRIGLALTFAAAFAGCRGAAPGTPARTPGAAADASPTPLGPARWVLTDRLGASFDEGTPNVTLPRPEAAIVDGARVRVENGIVLAWRRDAERMAGLRSLPARLGGGFVIWSEGRVYRAADALGDLSPIADIGAAGGVRPYLGSFVVRSASGLHEVDARTLAIRRMTTPGIVDALALDDKRAARLDAFGRASFTVDGGASWTDVLAKIGLPIGALREQDGELALTVESWYGGRWLLGKTGDLHTPKEPASRRRSWPWSDQRTGEPTLSGLPGSSRALAGAIVAYAAAAGALLPGARMLVGRDNGLRMLSAESALPLADGDLANVDTRFGRCQPLAPGGPGREHHGALLACAGDQGSEVLALDEAFARPRLEATFADVGKFLAGPNGRLAFSARCGPDAPSPMDLGATPKPPPDLDEGDPLQGALPPQQPPEPPTPEPPSAEEARVCVRADASRWIERRLSGGIARHFYRWVPGDDGTVTAIVLGTDEEPAEASLRRPKDEAPAKKEKDAAKPAEDRIGEGVRVIRVDPKDESLAGGAFVEVPGLQRDGLIRTIDADFWEEDGAVRGWIRLPPEGDAKPPPIEPSAQGPASRMLRVSRGRGGRMAGARIDARGRVTVFPLPASVVQVVTGGRFALAMARKDDVETWHETIDGGRTWTPVEGPPSGRIEAPSDGSTPFGCSAIGCTWGSGVVRLGWGGPKPAAREDAPKLAAASNPKPREPAAPKVKCSFEGDRAPWIEPPVTVTKPPAKPPPAKPPPAPKPPPAKPPPAKPPPAPAKPPPPGKPGAKPPAPRPSPPPGPVSPPLPISLRQPSSSPIGALREHAWAGDVVPPFQPLAALRRLSASDPTLGSALGSVVPILSAARDPVDLLLLVDKRRIRAGASGSLAGFDSRWRPTSAADGPGGALIAFDAERGTVGVARGDATGTVFRMARAPEVIRARLALGRRADGVVAVVGYSPASGDVFAGEIDLVAAEVRPLVALGRVETLAEAGACGDAKLLYRVVVEAPIALEIAGKAGASWLNETFSAALLVAAGADRLCLEGVEVGLSRGQATTLSATFRKGAAVASVRSGGKTVRGVCSLAGP